MTWIKEHKILGPISLAATIILVIISGIPSTFLLWGGGWAFISAYDSAFLSWLIGLPTCFAGVYIGSNLGFLIARYTCNSCFKKVKQKFSIFNALDRALEDDKKGAKIVMLLRMTPVLPYNAFNYLMGVTSISFKSFAIGNIGLIPDTIVEFYIGTTVAGISDFANKDSKEEASTLKLVMMIVGAVCGCAAMIYISRVVK